MHPLVKSRNEDHLAGSGATFFNSDLYCLVDHTSAAFVSGRWTATEKDRYNAELVCLRRDFQEPLVIPLKFDLEQIHHVPLPGTQQTVLPQSTWMDFADGNLYIGQSESPGIWVIPIVDIKNGIAAQKQALLAKKNK